MDLFVSALVTGIGLGSMYGLLALGFYVTYAVSSTVNFAQGSTMMLGAVMGFTFGKDPRGMPSSALTAEAFSVAGLRVSILQVVIPVAGLLIAVALHLLTRCTRMGKSMLAIVQNPDAARLMGIDVRAAIVASYAVSGLFAGIAGLLIAPLFTVSSSMGTLFGIKAFAVAILGGIANPWGVMLAGLIYGSAESLITAGFGSTYTQILTFGLVIVALALRPDGLFGRAGVKKV
jgi:branched-chain amino acid transport system permease protein